MALFCWHDVQLSYVLILRFCSLFLKLYMVMLPSISVISSFCIPPLDLFGHLVNFFSQFLVHILKRKATGLLLWQHLGSGTVFPSTYDLLLLFLCLNLLWKPIFILYVLILFEGVKFYFSLCLSWLGMFLLCFIFVVQHFGCNSCCF